MIELQTSVKTSKQDDTTRTRTPKPGYLKLTNKIIEESSIIYIYILYIYILVDQYLLPMATYVGHVDAERSKTITVTVSILFNGRQIEA
jgi:hypothetical protein